jgi:hypothetical protein
MALGLLVTLAAAASPASAQGVPPDSTMVERVEPVPVAVAVAPAKARDGTEALVPELADHPYRIAPGTRPYRNRLAFSPGYGRLGSKPLFIARVTYHPSAWLGYEWSFGHNPGQSVHAALHQLSAIVRRPFAGRLQPYVSAGYGMMMVFPGQSINAAPVTKNALTYGGGLELHIRGDLAVRADVRHATVIGRERGQAGSVAYDYLQQTIGLAFFRSIRP